MRLLRWLYGIPLRLSLSLWRRQAELDLDDELRDHLERQTEMLVSEGLSSEAARRAATHGLEGLEQCKERCRDIRPAKHLDEFAGDLRFGFRLLRRNLLFAVFAVLILGIGMGGTTAVFNIIHAVLLRPLPYAEGRRLVVITETIPREQLDNDQVSYPLFLDWTRQARSMETMGAFFLDADTVHSGKKVLHLEFAYASAGLFRTLGIQPMQGRTFDTREDQPSGNKVAVLSEALWKQQFSGDRNVVGDSITIGTQVFTVIGVMPSEFSYATPGAQLWVPLGQLADAPYMKNRDVCFLTVVGRLKEKTRTSTAIADLNAIQSAAQRAFPGKDRGHGTFARPLRDFIVGSTGSTLLLLGMAVLCLLLIACGNITGLLMERSAGRQREFAMRAALGAPRNRIARQIVTETALLALFGGAAGALLSKLVITIFASNLGRQLPEDTLLTFNSSVWWFALAITALAGLATGLVPALTASRSSSTEKLKATAATSTGSTSRQRGRRLLIVSETALTVVLLCTAGLLIQSLYRLLQVDPGFRTDHLLTMTVSLPDEHYATRGSVLSFFDQVINKLTRLPGVSSTSAVSTLPISGGDSQGQITLESHPFASGQAPSASFRRVLPNYFRMMGIPVLAGREFTDSDQGRSNGSPMVVLINERMAHTFWPDAMPVGQRIKIGPAEGEPWLTVVGVVGDVHNTRLDAEPSFATYEPLSQRVRTTMTFVVRTDIAPQSVADSAQAAVHQTEPEAAVFDVMSMDDRISNSLAPRWLNTVLISGFAGLALLLTLTGIYATVSYSVRQRTPEIGLRMALGAHPAGIVRMIVSEGLRIGIAGVATGVMMSVAIGRAVQFQVFAVRASDPRILAATATFILAIAALASYLPARRATRIDPTLALRNE